jgi:hypothetical protein
MDIIQIIDPDHKHYPCLAIVSSRHKDGVKLQTRQTDYETQHFTKTSQYVKVGETYEDTVRYENDHVKVRLDQELIQFVEQGKVGVHYCPDWDFLAIHSESPEKESCLCKI